MKETVAKFMLPLKELTIPLLVAICINGSANILAGFESTIVSFPKDVFAVAYKIGLRDERYPWLVASAPLGAAIGCLPLLSGALTDRLGRKRAMMIVQVVYMLAALMTSTANGYDQFFAGRFFAGFAVGAMTNIAPVYMAELCPTAVRAGLVGLTQVLIVLGVLLGFASSKPFVSAKPALWAPAFACATPFSALLLCLIPFTPESPRWLMAQGRTEEARAVLHQVRAARGADDKARAASVEAELSVIAKSLAKVRGAGAEGAAGKGWLSRAAATLAAPHLLLAMGTGFTLGMFQQMSGMAAINRYSSAILGSGGAGFSAMAAVDAAIALNAWKLITVIVGDLILDHFGRRPILFWGCLGMAASMLGVGGILRSAGGAVLTSDQSTAVVALIALYILFYEVSVGPLLWVLSSEMFPTEVRGTAMSSGSTAVWLFSFAVSYFFPQLVLSYGLDGAFFFFGGFTCVAVLWAYSCVPETHRLPLEEVQSALKRWALLRWLTRAARFVRRACGLPAGPELEVDVTPSSSGEPHSLVALRGLLCSSSEGLPPQAARLAPALLPERMCALAYGPALARSSFLDNSAPQALPVVMTVAGSDSGGGAGIQADLKACSALGVFGTCAVTALTAQDSTGVQGVHAAPPAFLAQQMKVVLADFKPQAIKTGMLADEATIHTVCTGLSNCDASSRPLLIVDPVMVATSGARLIEEGAVNTLISTLLPMAHMVTPNLPEAEVLLGQAAGSIRTVSEMVDAAKAIAALGPAWALVKGGHLASPLAEGAAGIVQTETSSDNESVKVTLPPTPDAETVLIPSETVVDVLYCKATGAICTWSSPRVDTVNLHGTGCTLSASIAACLSRAQCLPTAGAEPIEVVTIAAVDAARRYLQLCLRGSARVRLGHGKTGPFNHAVAVDDWQAGDAAWTAAMKDARLLC